MTPGMQLPEAVERWKRLLKLGAEYEEEYGSTPETKANMEAASVVLAALPQPIKDEAFEQKLRAYDSAQHRAANGDTLNDQKKRDAARAAVLSAHANAIAQAERAGMERAAKIVETELLGSEVNTVIRVIRDWLADRLVNVYQENPNVDFVLSCRARAKHLRALITKYKP